MLFGDWLKALRVMLWNSQVPYTPAHTQPVEELVHSSQSHSPPTWIESHSGDVDLRQPSDTWRSEDLSD